MTLQDLVGSLLTVAPAQLADDASAARAIVAIRWPSGPRCTECPSTATHRGTITLVCDDERCGEEFSIFVGTALGSLRRPRPRALLLALRAIATDKRGISARGLARIVKVPHVTLWRHIHRLRELLPGFATRAPPTAFVQVCGRVGSATPASTSVAHASSFSFATAGIDCVNTNPTMRIVGESIRTWLSGTFHGVTARWLAAYLCEATTRSTHAPTETIAHVLARLLAPPPSVPAPY